MTNSNSDASITPQIPFDQLQIIIQKTDAAAFLLDVSASQIRDVNRRACDLLGFRQEELLRMGISALHPGDEERFRKFAGLVIQQGVAWTDEIKYMTKGGEALACEISASRVESEGRTLLLAVVKEVMGPARQSSRELDQLHALNQMKDAYISDVIHELRTPISSLKLIMHILAVKPEELPRFQGSMMREVERLEQIITDLRRLTRIDQGVTSLKLTRIDLGDTVRQYIEDRVPLAAQKNIRLHCGEMPHGLTTLADRRLLVQVLAIILSNAINYTPKGGEIMINTHVLEGEGSRSWAGFSVSDTGPGIPLEEQERLFDRFFRGKAARESDIMGTGLGLAIARRIVEYHDGFIEVESEGIPGRGTTFYVWVPHY